MVYTGTASLDMLVLGVTDQSIPPFGLVVASELAT